MPNLLLLAKNPHFQLSIRPFLIVQFYLFKPSLQFHYQVKFTLPLAPYLFPCIPWFIMAPIHFSYTLCLIEFPFDTIY